VQQKVTLHRIVQCGFVVLFQCLLHAAQAGGGAAVAGIAGSRVVVVQFAFCPASGEIALIEVVQIFFVFLRVNAQPVFHRLVQPPADVIVAAQIVHEPTVVRQGVQGIQLRLQQPGVPAGKGTPQVDHGGHVVEHMAFRFFRGAEISCQLLGSHDHLALEDDRRADTFQHHAEHPHNGVHLRQIAAGGAQLLPDVGYRINAEHLYAQICKVQDAPGHVHEHRRVGIVQIPLVVVEGGQHPLVHLLTPCKVAGRGVGEHLGHSLLVLVGDGAVLVEVVIGLKPRVARLCRHGPAVGTGGVIHDKIQTQADAGLAQLPGQVFQVFVGAKGRVYGVEVLHRIAAVVVGVGHLQKGHQVQIGQLLFFQVGQLLCQFF